MSDTPESADVVVVGGGVIGLAVARALALRGVRNVLLIERSSLGTEASFAAAGMLAPQAEADQADDFFYLACQSRDMYPAFAEALHEESGVDIELETTGTLYLAFTEADVEEIERRYVWQAEAGLQVEKLDAVPAKALEPMISQNVRAALKFPLDMQVENRRLIKALAIANERYGVHIHTDTAVQSLKVDGSRIAGVETSSGFIATENVVIASGAWSSLLGRSEKTQGIKTPFEKSPPDKAFESLRIEPVRGQMLSFQTNSPIARHVIYSPRGYIVPRAGGRLLAGSTTESVGFDKRVTDEGIHGILTAAQEISPGIIPLSVSQSWAGLRPRAPDGLPVLGPCAEIEGVFYATGHYRNGILLTPITGELMAQAIVENVVSPALSTFSPDRFGLVTVNS